MSADVSSSEPPPHVIVRDRTILLDGEPMLPFGGELQYFRVRAESFDGDETQALWAARLDQLFAAGINLVSTYVPWDYHALAEGRYDWEGARDLARFVGLCEERGLKVIIKPGPYILAEWPYGFGSYGAVPLWWRKKHRRALVRDRWGRVFRWHPIAPALGRGRSTLASYASTEFRQAFREWFRAVHEQLRGFFGPGRPIIGVQLDNETNLFWSDVYRIDHHPEALARYRARLAERYGTPERLSKVYGRRVRRFEEVRPPRHPHDGPDVRHRDWIRHQEALVAEYLGEVRAAWEDLGVREPDVLFFTNDTLQTFRGRDLLLPHGETKTRHGVYGLDTYPRGLPLPGDVLFDTPFEPELGAKLQAHWNSVARPEGGRFSFGLEVQGGHFALPVPGMRVTFSPHTVRPEATRQTLLRLLVHGMRGMVVYTAVGGLNLDGSDYDFQASLGRTGRETPRFEELKRFGRLLDQHGAALRRAAPVESSVAILASGELLGPGHGHTGEQRIFGSALRGVFGWCALAGITPAVLDVSGLSRAALGRYRAVLFPSSRRMSGRVARRLCDYVESGGTLIQLLSPGRLGATLFPGAMAPSSAGVWGWITGAFGARELLRRTVRARFQAERVRGSFALRLSGRVPLVRPPADGRWVLAPAGSGDRVYGYERAVGRGRAVFLVVSPGGMYEGRGLYDLAAGEVYARGLFLRRLLSEAGVKRLFGCAELEEAHALRDPEGDGALYVCVFSHHREAATLHVRLRGLSGLQLDPDRRYEVHDVYGAEDPPAVPLSTLTGAALREEGLHLGLGPFGATVVRVRSAS